MDRAPDSDRIAGGLARILDDTRALEAKTGRFLRDVEGPASARLRPLLAKQRLDLGVAVDRLDCAMRAVGLTPPRPRTSSPSSVHRGPIWTAGQMVACLLREHELLVRRTERVLRLTEGASDVATRDLLRQRVEEHEVAAWGLVAIGVDALLREEAPNLEP